MRTVQEPGHLERNGALSENRLIVDVSIHEDSIDCGHFIMEKTKLKILYL